MTGQEGEGGARSEIESIKGQGIVSMSMYAWAIWRFGTVSEYWFRALPFLIGPISFFSKLAWMVSETPLKRGSASPNGVCGRSMILVIGLKDGGGGQKCACADFLSGDRPESLSLSLGPSIKDVCKNLGFLGQLSPFNSHNQGSYQ